MNCISRGRIRKKEMPVVEDPDSMVGNFWPKRRATRAISSPLSTTSHSPFPWIPLVWAQSSE